MRRTTPAILLASLAFTYLFFLEYLPPFRQVHIPYDLDGYHFPLADYAFQNLRQGHFPQWDPTIYCGMSFVANMQAALFYPPMWILFVASLGQEHLSYQGLEDLVFAHVWLAFVLCYFWLRGRRLHELACALGAGAFAFSGYLCTQLQHFGLAAGYAWFPLALWGIDDARDRQSWKPLWKVALASAMCFLAGYPPTWVVLAVAATAYAFAGSRRWKVTAGVLASLAASMVLTMVQLLPAMEASRLLAPDPRYGAGIHDPAYLLFYLTPNYYNFGLDVPVGANPGTDCFWLGAPALLGLAFLFRRANKREIWPLLGMAAAILVFITNPFGMVWAVLRQSNLLSSIFRGWYFFAGLTLAVAALTAYGLDDFLRRPHRPAPSWISWAGLLCAGGWAAADLWRWMGLGFWSGWRSGIDAGIAVAALGVTLYAFRSLSGTLKARLALALLLSVGIDYKVFGTSKRFDASMGRGPRYSSTEVAGMDVSALQRLRANSVYRVLLDQASIEPADLRHLSLATPQGFDPFLTAQLRHVVNEFGKFRGDREYDLDLANDAALHLFGIRYAITTEHGPYYPQLVSSPKFEMVGSKDSYFKVFEYHDPRPPFAFESTHSEDRLDVRAWHPEAREFAVRSVEGGRVTNTEQLLPGWSAMVDGRTVALESWHGAFQSVAVPAGEHTVEFRYRSRWLALGAWISLVSLIGLVLWWRWSAS